MVTEVAQPRLVGDVWKIKPYACGYFSWRKACCSLTELNFITGFQLLHASFTQAPLKDEAVFNPQGEVPVRFLGEKGKRGTGSG